MKLSRLFHRNKSLIFLLVFIYFLFWLTLSTIKQINDLNKPHVSHQLKFRSNGTFYFVINQLFQLQINLVLIDPYVLQYLFIHRLSFDNVDRQFITFAIIDQSLQTLMQSLNDMKFSIKTSKTVLPNQKKVIDHIFIEHEHITVHITVLHKYNSYYRIHKNYRSLSEDIQLPFGDKLRAVDYFETELHEYLFYYPRNVSHFLWLYNSSEFIRCDRKLAERMKKQYHIHESVSQLSLVLKPMVSIGQGLDQLQKHYWIAGGTLLGWYRHCGLIPYTGDVDFGLFEEEYDESIRHHFLGNPVTHIWAALGLVNDSLEFRLSSGRYVFDLFWTYREDNTRWYGYQAQRSKYRRSLPLFSKVCSGDLYGYRFSVPCLPIEYLDHEYGKDNWLVPLQKDYKWVNMKYHSMWNDISWMYAVRLYSPEGHLRSDELAISWVAKRFNYTYSSVPSFLNALPNEDVTLPPLKSEFIQNKTRIQTPRPATKKQVEEAEEEEENEKPEEQEAPEINEKEDEEKPEETLVQEKEDKKTEEAEAEAEGIAEE
ncbi:hypothetical protein I4U23_028017 [Adineta vaga]|nr:hypothetical protein I4U23_028017 [Adineta vaga]